MVQWVAHSPSLTSTYGRYVMAPASATVAAAVAAHAGVGTAGAVAVTPTQIVIAGCKSYTEFTGKETPTVVGVMNAAATTVEFGPC